MGNGVTTLSRPCSSIIWRLPCRSTVTAAVAGRTSTLNKDSPSKAFRKVDFPVLKAPITTTKGGLSKSSASFPHSVACDLKKE